MNDVPSMDQWLREAKEEDDAGMCGMYLVHNGTVRQTAKAMVREGEEGLTDVIGMNFSFDSDKVEAAIMETSQREGIYYVRAWLNEGKLNMGDDIMYVMIGGDIRPRVVDALQFLVGKIKNECVIEEEVF
ncbi:MAG: molybdopterin biosynthesis protein [Lachnospiraceae bacterium]|nr:molybdopterin biosynthesis protein [Lachnospiraceae bacterium]